MRKLCAMFFVSLAALAAPAYALDLSEARSKGLVCERADGMLSARGGAGDVKDLVAEVNAGRKAEYERIAAANGQSASVVGQITAQQLIGKGYAACK